MDWLERPRKPARVLLSRSRMENIYGWLLPVSLLLIFSTSFSLAHHFSAPGTSVTHSIFFALVLTLFVFAPMLFLCLIGATDKLLLTTLVHYIVRSLGISAPVNAKEAEFISQQINTHPRLPEICATIGARNQHGTLTFDDFERIYKAILKIKRHEKSHVAWKAEQEDLEAVKQHFNACGLQDRISAHQQHSALQSSTPDTTHASTDRRL